MAELATVMVAKFTDLILLGLAVLSKVTELATVTATKSTEMVLFKAHMILLATATIN
jgi:hypothetical protein